MTKEDIYKIREYLGLTQDAMSKFIGVPLRTWQQWEHGQRKPSHAAQAWLKHILECPSFSEKLKSLT